MIHAVKGSVFPNYKHLSSIYFTVSLKRVILVSITGSHFTMVNLVRLVFILDHLKIRYRRYARMMIIIP